MLEKVRKYGKCSYTTRRRDVKKVALRNYVGFMPNEILEADLKEIPDFAPL